MKNYFTQEDLIRFIYREMPPEEESRMRQKITEDSEFAIELHRLMEMVMMLDEMELQPSETSVNLILDYSREQIEQESHA